MSKYVNWRHLEEIDTKFSHSQCDTNKHVERPTKTSLEAVFAGFFKHTFDMILAKSFGNTLPISSHKLTHK